jgi:hypothetical protein
MPPKERRDNTVLNKLIEIERELSINTTETKNIVTRLDKLNGSVAEHARTISILERATDANTQTLVNISNSEEKNAKTKSDWVIWFQRGLAVIALYLLYSLLTTAGIVKPFLH